MKDGDRRIRCGVSEPALEVFEPKFDRNKEGRLVAFNKHRAHIESVASDKYDLGEIERDGRTILVSAADIDRHLSDARNQGERTGEIAGSEQRNLPDASALKRPWFD
jgi:hypothetical protein